MLGVLVATRASADRIAWLMSEQLFERELGIGEERYLKGGGVAVENQNILLSDF